MIKDLYVFTHSVSRTKTLSVSAFYLYVYSIFRRDTLPVFSMVMTHKRRTTSTLTRIEDVGKWCQDSICGALIVAECLLPWLGTFLVHCMSLKIVILHHSRTMLSLSFKTSRTHYVLSEVPRPSKPRLRTSYSSSEDPFVNIPTLKFYPLQCSPI